MSYTLEISQDPKSIRKIVLEIASLSERVNIARYKGEVPDTKDTVRLTELSDVLYGVLGLDDIDESNQ